MGNDLSFTRNLILVVVFLTLTPLALATSLFALVSLSASKIQAQDNQLQSQVAIAKNGARIYAALPGNLPSVFSEVGAADARIEIIKQYLASYDSPLLPHAQKIIDAADQYKIDFRLITAIAQQESNLCKIIPPGSFNCWGWGITGEDTLGFSSFDQGIEVVTRGLKENYIDEGFLTPDQIMTKYTPASPGSWARGVNLFMSEME